MFARYLERICAVYARIANAALLYMRYNARAIAADCSKQDKQANPKKKCQQLMGFCNTLVSRYKYLWDYVIIR